jgi:hypothetical protein
MLAGDLTPPHISQPRKSASTLPGPRFKFSQPSIRQPKPQTVSGPAVIKRMLPSRWVKNDTPHCWKNDKFLSFLVVSSISSFSIQHVFLHSYSSWYSGFTMPSPVVEPMLVPISPPARISPPSAELPEHDQVAAEVVVTQATTTIEADEDSDDG